MTSNDSMFLKIVAVTLLIAAWYYPAKDLSQPKIDKTNLVKVADINCTDGSKWKKVEVSTTLGAYDLYNNNKWIARVPSGMCAMMASE